MTDKYAVIGNPVAHSQSPLIHAEFARQTGQDIAYAAVLAPLDGFQAEVLKFRNGGGKGLNVTLPFKHEAWCLVDTREGYAADARAVNTIRFADGQLTGFNTDGIGLMRDIRNNLRCPIKGKRVLLMGSGGASYGVMEPLLLEQPEHIVIANRTLEKAVGMAGHFDALRHMAAVGIEARTYSSLECMQFDIVINATSAGLTGQMPELPGNIFAAEALAYDMVYGKTTPFLRFAQDHGARIAEGTGMLVEQAAESFYIWRGVRPQTAPVIAMLRKA
jgi:shikimate dehydrogenase